MNERISWDPSLVKKFSSSNHFKLLNQLRNEVKKYPLNNKKHTTSYQNKDINNENINKQSDKYSQEGTFSKDFNIGNGQTSDKSSISFNNSKNFSIYNQTNNNNFARQNQTTLNDQTQSGDETPAPSFKERLDQIDMK